MRENFKIYGEIASYGTCEGFSITIPEYESYISKKKLKTKQSKIEEIRRFHHYLDDTIKKIKNIQNKLDNSVKELIDIQIYFLKDPIFIEEVEKSILSGKNLIQSIYESSDKVEKYFKESSNNYIKQRWIDLKEAIFYLLEEITGVSYSEIVISKVKELNKIYKNYILVANDLSPLLFLKLPKPAGILLSEGNLFGHLILLAANQGIPILVNCFPKEDFKKISDGLYIQIQTNKGYAIINPKKPIKKINSKEKENIKDYKINKEILISLNTEDLDVIKKHKKNYKLSIGLFRSEFLYIQNPELILNFKKSVETYYNIFQLFEENEMLTLRLIDVDEDKYSKCFYTKSENIGKRGMEYYHSEINIIQNQIKSILSAFKKIKKPKWLLRILIPMISNYEDWIFIKNLLIEEVNSLSDIFRKNFQIGIMLEVPSVFYIIKKINDINFLSLGTNDLLSFFIGKKRNLIKDEDYYEPSFYKMLYTTLKDLKKEISICGNLATKKEFLKILYFLGVRNFSVPINLYSEIYQYLENLLIKEQDQKIFLDLIESKDRKEFKEKLANFNNYEF